MLKRPLLSVANRRDRFMWWCQRRVLWRDCAWDTIVWSDESHQCLDSSDGRLRVWREVGQRFDSRFIKETRQGNGFCPCVGCHMGRWKKPVTSAKCQSNGCSL